MSMGFRLFVGVVIAVVLCGSVRATTDSIPTSSGAIEVTPIVHGSLQMVFNGIVIHVDPWSRGDYSSAPTADLILITDIHGDHLDAAMVDRLSDDDTVVVAPAAVVAELGRGTALANGDSLEIVGLIVRAVPMYNIERGSETGQLFHDKGRGNGYVVTMGDKHVYIAGDTACIPEMKALQNIDVAFVPMNLPYTMPPDEASACVAAFKPTIVYPYHYRGSDLEVFKAGLDGIPEVEVRVRNWYPGD